jgi:hypothetical protein
VRVACDCDDDLGLITAAAAFFAAAALAARRPTLPS